VERYSFFLGRALYEGESHGRICTEKTVHLSGFSFFYIMQYFTVDVEAAKGFGTDYYR
jgi:hypothetical protein